MTFKSTAKKLGRPACKYIVVVDPDNHNEENLIRQPLLLIHVPTGLRSRKKAREVAIAALKNETETCTDAALYQKYATAVADLHASMF